MRKQTTFDFYSSSKEIIFDNLKNGDPIWLITGGAQERESLKISKYILDIENKREYVYGFGKVFSLIIPIVNNLGEIKDHIQFIKQNDKYRFKYSQNWCWVNNYKKKNIVRQKYFFTWQEVEKEIDLRNKEFLETIRSMTKAKDTLENSLEYLKTIYYVDSQKI